MVAELRGATGQLSQRRNETGIPRVERGVLVLHPEPVH